VPEGPGLVEVEGGAVLIFPLKLKAGLGGSKKTKVRISLHT